MPASKEVAPRDEAALPALQSTPALDIDQSAVELPRLYMGQPQSEAVADGRVPAHCLFWALGADDPDPNIVWTTDDGEEGVLVHVLSMTQGLSATVGDDLRSYHRNSQGEFVDRFGEPAPDDAYPTYNYVLCLPEIEPELPIKFLLKKSSAKTAKRVNFLLMRNKGPAHQLAFRLTTKGMKKEQQRWTEAVMRRVDADPKNVLIADELVQMLAGMPIEATDPSNEPEL